MAHTVVGKGKMKEHPTHDRLFCYLEVSFICLKSLDCGAVLFSLLFLLFSYDLYLFYFLCFF